jgi:two-component system, OmpR family, alkaline phosphatase synthesis response regulator PhoP
MDAKTQPKVVLIVCEEKHIRRLIEVNLERARYGVITARDRLEALQKAKYEKPDLVVVEGGKDFMDDLLQNLRLDSELSQIPVVQIERIPWGRVREYRPTK